MNFWKIWYYKILSKRSTFIHFIQPFPTLNQNPGFLRLLILITDLNNMDMVNLLTLSAVIYKTFFIKNYCVHKYSEENIKKMLAFLNDNIYVVFWNQFFQQSVWIPVRTNRAFKVQDNQLQRALFLFNKCFYVRSLPMSMNNKWLKYWS